MNPLVLGSLISGGASLISGLVGSGLQYGVAQNDLELQKLSMAEQKRLNNFQMREYLDKKDYDRALQERIFEREDTAMQRSLQDFTEAGFSPLSALGQTANAGAIVSTSSAPSLDAPSAPDLSGMYGAVDHMVTAGHEAGARVSTFLSQMAQQQHEFNMENLRFANALDQLTEGHKNQKEVIKLEHDLREGSAEAQHLRDLEKITETNEFQKTMAEFQANEARYLQTKQQEWQAGQSNIDRKRQDKQARLDREHQIEMQKQSHYQALHALDVQDKHKQQYEKKTLAYAWSDLSKEGKDLFVKMIRKFDSSLADYIQNNEFGGDLLMRVIAMYESALPVAGDTKDLINPLHGLFGN